MIKVFVIKVTDVKTKKVTIHDTGFYELQDAQDELAKLTKCYQNKYKKTKIKTSDKIYEINQVRIIWENGRPYV